MSDTAATSSSDTTATSSKRAQANRRNAQKSTGPTSPSGKDKSRFNALKHGMRARLPLLPGEDGGAFRARLDAWTISLEPRDDLERYLVERAVNVSWQLDRADRAWAARLKADLLSSGSAQALAQADEVLVLGRRLFWDPRGPVELYPQFRASLGSPMRVSWSQDIEDPDEPGRLVNRLEGTALGCAWLLDRWNELGDLLEDGLKWQAPDRFKATRLLGKQPLEPIDDLQVRWIHLCASAMDPECEHEFGDVTNELHTAEWDRFVERLEAREAWREKPEEAEVAKAALLELVSEQEERLETLLAAHLERESAADPDALGFQDTAEGERLRRYQMACNRTLLRILETLRKRHRESDQAKEGGKRRRKSSGVDSTSEADLLRETFGPVIGRDQETRAQQSEVVLSDDSAGRESPDPAPLVGRGSADPAIRPTVGLPVHENVTNEATALLVGLDSPAPSMTESLPPISTEHSHRTNEATDPIRSDAGPLASALAKLALLLLVGLSMAFVASAGVIGVDWSPRMPRDTAGLQVTAKKRVASIDPARPRPVGIRSPRIVPVPRRL